MSKTEVCVESYERLKNLKLVEKETGIKWQTVYAHLKKAGVSVCGDKARYGSVTDRLARHAELLFKEKVPFAIDNNESKFQSTVDFIVGDASIDVKAATLKKGGRQKSGKSYSARWGFCISKQKDVADFFVMYALEEDKSVRHIFLIPKEMATTCTTISIPESLKSKWADYMIEESDIEDFFREFYF